MREKVSNGNKRKMVRKQQRKSRRKHRTPSQRERGAKGQGGWREGRWGEAGWAGGEEKRVMWRDLALESGGCFIKRSKVQVEKVRMDLTCLRRR